jgi:peptidoglycan/xylan/chitin deacetylase (PgdA/CDA1 family)
MASQAAEGLGDRAEARRWANLAAAISPADTPRSALAQTAADAAPLVAGHPGRRVVALSFDDGPHAGPTDRILAILARERAKATFFAVGKYAAADPSLVRRIAQAGMELANHSFSHPNLTLLPDRAIADELLRTSACIADITGSAPAYFRPPGGRMCSRVARVAAGLGIRPCMWTVNATYAEAQGPVAVTTAVLGGVRPGAIVLLHNGSPATTAALPGLIGALRARGYEFVTVSELARGGM